MRKSGGRPRGQDLVEYALLVPFTLLAILALFDLGRLVYAYSVLQNAAREGARYATVRNPTAEAAIESYILKRTPGLQLSTDDISFAWNDCSEGTLPDLTKISLPAYVTVFLEVNQDSILLGNLKARANARMKMENCLP